MTQIIFYRFRMRTMTTHVGSIELKVQDKLRDEKFSNSLLRYYQPNEQVLELAIMKMVICSMSTQKLTQ
jgi:transposase-like protein